MQAHSQPESATGYSDTNGRKHEETVMRQNPKNWLKFPSRILLKKLLFGNNNSSFLKRVECNVKISFLQESFQIGADYLLVSTELMQQKQRVGDLEEELELLQKQLRSTQTKVIEQVND